MANQRANGRDRVACTSTAADYQAIAIAALASGDPVRSMANALAEAYQAGRASTKPDRPAHRGTRDIEPSSMSSRTREAFETLRALSGAQLRDDMEVILLREEEDFTGSRRINLLQPKGWNEHSWGPATLAPLRNLQILVPVEGHTDMLTLSRRGADLMVKGRTTTDVSAAPFWDITPAQDLAHSP